MRAILKTVVAGLILFGPVRFAALAQDSTGTLDDRGGALSFFGGLSKLVVRDEYVSREKYSGGVPLVGMTWSGPCGSSEYAFQFQYQSTTQLKNYSVAARVLEASLRSSLLFESAQGTIFGQKASFWLGPEIDMVVHNRRQKIASEVDVTMTLGFIGATVQAAGFYTLGANCRLEGATHFMLLSYVRKSNRSNDNRGKLVSPRSGLNALGEMRMRWFADHSLSFSVEYRLDITRVSVWEDFVSASDMGILSATYYF